MYAMNVTKALYTLWEKCGIIPTKIPLSEQPLENNFNTQVFDNYGTWLSRLVEGIHH
ncbi:MAG: hypothetical protein QXP20_06755 [Candidatus Bathyarchaeia archaeon]